MHRIHDVGERETLVRQEFLEFARIPGYFPLLPAFVLRTGLRRSR
jgi:hypothetical protein